ncbi:MAG: tetratricopeptide repeat protein [Candidatus Kapabacteria bacterium]|nr:tetratricopeptide repeat protein [Candidatus Kapabacteria bacterium]
MLKRRFIQVLISDKNNGIKKSYLRLVFFFTILISSSGISQIVETIPDFGSYSALKSKEMFDFGIIRLSELYTYNVLKNFPTSSSADKESTVKGYFDLIHANYTVADADLTEFITNRSNSPFVPFASLIRSYIALQQKDYVKAEYLLVETQKYADYFEKENQDTIYRTIAHEALYWRGISLSQTGKYQNASEVFQECVKRFPEGNFADDALYALGQNSEINHKYEDAISFFSNISKNYYKTNSVIAARIREANNRIILRDAANAQVILESTEQIYDHLKSQDSIGKTFQIQTYSSQAGEEILYLKGEAYNQTGNYSKAVDQFKSFIETYYESPLKNYVRLGAGWALLNMNKPENALKYFNDIILEISKEKDLQIIAAAQLYKAIALKNNGEIDEAKKELSELSIDPNYPNHGQVLLELGQIYYENADYEQSRRTLERAERESSDANISIRTHILLGSAYVELKQWEKAATELKLGEKIALNSSDIFMPKKRNYLSEIRLKLGLALFRKEKHFEAAQQLLKFISDSKSDSRIDEAIFWLAESYYFSDLFKNSITTYKNLIDQYPESNRREEALYGLGWTYFRLKDFENSSIMFEQMLKEFPKSEFALEALSRQADGYYVIKNYRAAADSYKRAKNLAPNSEEGQYSAYQLCHAYYKMNQFEPAINSLLDFVKNYPHSSFAPHALYLTGWIRFLQHKYIEAIDDFRYLIASYGKSILVVRAKYTIADSYYNMGNYDKALISYKDVIEQYPSDALAPEAMKGVQFCLMALGRDEEAIAVADTFIASNPTSPIVGEIQRTKGRLLFVANKFKDAISEFENYVKKNPDSEKNAEAFYWMEKSYISMNDSYNAELAYHTLDLKFPESEYNASGLLDLALMFKEINNIDKAATLFEDLKKRFPKNQSAAQAGYELALLKFATNDTNTAVGLFREVADNFPGTDFSDQCRYKIAMFYRSKSMADSARTEFNFIAQHTDNHALAAEAEYRTGELWLREENFIPAINAFSVVKDKFAGFEDWYSLSMLCLGECYEKTKNIDAAREIYRALETLRPEDEFGKTAKHRLSRLPKNK